MFSRKPSKISIDVTNRCNSRCITCNIWKHEKEDDLDIKYIYKFVTQILRLSGPKLINLAGGEPLLREDIFDIIKFINKKGGKVRLITNGLLLNKENIDKLASSGLSRLNISINSMNPEIHDKSRGISGNLEIIKKAVEYIRRNHQRIKLEINMVLFKDNLDEVVPVIKYAHKNHANLSIQPIQIIYDKAFAKNDESKFLFDDLGKLKQTLLTIQRYKKKGHKIYLPDSFIQRYINYYKNPNKPKSCNIGNFKLTLYNNGNMNFCFSHKPIGNIFDNSVKKAWNSSIALRNRKMMRKCNIKCASFCNIQPTFSDNIKEARLFIMRKIKNAF